MSKRSIVYIDGFNLYYGALRGGPDKWLDLEKYFRMLRANDDILCVNYFSALVMGPAQANQKTYLRALQTTPLVQVILGRFKTKQVRCGVKTCTFTGKRNFPAPEEKRTDVNIAVHIVADAYEDLCDNIIVVSGDSDLVPAIVQVKTKFPEKTVTVYVPYRDQTRGAAVELRSAADKHRQLPTNLLPRAQFPSQLPDGSGGIIHRPAGW